jgi:hypothetical protein
VESSSAFVAKPQHTRELRFLAGKSSSFWDNAADDDTLPSGTVEDNIGDETVAPTSIKRPYHNFNKEQSNSNKKCIPVDECRYCTAETVSSKNNNDQIISAVPQECIDTGRRQRYECTAADNGG